MAALRRHTIAALVVLALAAGGAWAWRGLSRRAAGPAVAVAAASRGEFLVSITAEGILQSDDAITISTGKAPGQLTMIVPDGTVVRAGDVFCRIEARDLLRRKTDAELAVKQASEEIARSRDSAEERYDTDQRALEQSRRSYQVWLESVEVRRKQAQAQLDYDIAEAKRLKLEYDRAQRMADKGYEAGSEAEIAKAAYDAQQFKVEQSQKDMALNERQTEADRKQKESALAAAEQRSQISRSRIAERVAHAQRHAEVATKELADIVAALADTTITAPVSGTVSLFSTWRGGERRSWREGDQVSSGTPLGSISGSRNMSLRCRVPESQIAALRKGQQAEIEFDSLVGRTFPGVVSSVGAVAREVWVWEDPTAEANERVFDVLVKVTRESVPGLKPGLNGRARIVLKRLEGVTFVPLEAVFERDDGSYVFVKRGDRFERKKVTTGERNEVAVVIRSGVSAGELVALSDPTRAPEPAARKAQ
ncbi:MAG: efflux RND transporter periplasmic adaptor subunit [Armatimonadota bacterium]